MILRAARQSDCLAVAEILVDAWRWAYRGIIDDEELEGLDVGARMRRLEERFDPNLLYLVAVEEDDLPIGFAVESRPAQLPQYDSEIGGLYVHPHNTRGGVGRVLVEAMAREFVERDAKTMAIHTLQENAIGRGFYEHMGGVVVHEDFWRQFPAVWYGWHDLPAWLAARSRSSSSAGQS